MEEIKMAKKEEKKIEAKTTLRPNFTGDIPVAIWGPKKDKNGNDYFTVKIFGQSFNCFAWKR